MDRWTPRDRQTDLFGDGFATAIMYNKKWKESKDVEMKVFADADGQGGF